MDYKKLSSDILHLVGGRDNVVAVTNCLTRLRFNLKDESKANDEAIKALDGVSGLVKKGGQYQVVIGTEVPSVYNALSKLIGDLDTPVKSTEKMKWSDRLIDTLSGIFTPILMPLTAAGMLKAVLAILVALHWVDSTSMTYQVINFMADSTFYFLPIFLANSAAKKFGCSPMLAMMLGVYCYILILSHW
ncbi:PTS transporter subunit EIIB [Faecalicoccus pleomorphus]|uniref:PTS transporter subunit EIIB n=1 Tax=Faecalicoccus pleomorphus TaxID=1323 RepID=UPI003DA54232